MFETITVDEALKKGRRMVTYPCLMFIFAGMGVSGVLLIVDAIPGWGFFIGLGLGVFLAWLYWSIVITKWRVWAFDNVRNVHELKKRAIKENLIWGDNNFFEKTEIRSAADGEKLNTLQSKFEKPDLFADDFEVPQEVKIYYSKRKSLFSLVIMIGVTGLGVWLVLSDSYFGIFSIGLGLVFIYSEIKHLINKNPQIVLNNEGVQTSSAPFYNWKDVRNEDVTKKITGESSTYYLNYDCPDGGKELQITDLDITHSALENLLRVYRGRNDKKMHTTSVRSEGSI
ncbi:MAG TPA: hypothetical protein VGI43_14700 [Mucilaginibacter sp.]|jgi:hypothetical protein